MIRLLLLLLSTTSAHKALDPAWLAAVPSGEIRPSSCPIHRRVHQSRVLVVVALERGAWSECKSNFLEERGLTVSAICILRAWRI